ncbi:MAG: hypothetical protein ACRD6B_02640 [Bryobacteraceae bacterium]
MQAAALQEWNRREAKSRTRLLRLFPSLTDFAFLFPLAIIFGFLKGSGMLFSDGDTGWHIRTGQWILAHGTVPKFDLFSYTKPHQHWFAWEWGWDTIFGGIDRVAGLAGVAFVTIVLLCLVSAILFRLIRRQCENDLAALAFTGLAMLVSTMHWLARPHLVSWLFALIFLHVVARAEAGNRRLLWSLPVLTIAWTNLHGAFLVGILILMASAIGRAIKGLSFAKRAPWRAICASAAPYLWCALGCLAATFVNPYGWRLHRHLLSYLFDSKLLNHISEFQSPNFHNPSMIFFEILLLLGIPSVVWCWRSKRYAAAILIVAWAHLALVSARNMPFFAFFAAPWVAAMVCDWARPLKGKAADTLREISRELRPMERVGRVYLVSGLAVFVVACGFLFHFPKFNARFSPKHFPVAAVPALEAAHVSHLFTTDQWSDYLIYRLYPSIRVFMDGRSDFYGPAFMTRYLHLLHARYNWQTELRHFGVDAVLVSPKCALATVLKEASGWQVLYDDGSAILFRRAGSLEGSPRYRNRAGSVSDPAPTTTFQAERSLQTGRPTSKFTVNYKRSNS